MLNNLKHMLVIKNKLKMHIAYFLVKYLNINIYNSSICEFFIINDYI